MNSSFIRVLLALVLFGPVTGALAQTAALKASASALAPAGGTLTLTATASYTARPQALGWAIVLPADWTLVGISGSNVPEIAPVAGEGGVLEFAFTAVPPVGAEFSVVVRYPPAAPKAEIAATVLVRADGKLTTLRPPVVGLTGIGS